MGRKEPQAGSPDKDECSSNAGQNRRSGANFIVPLTPEIIAQRAGRLRSDEGLRARLIEDVAASSLGGINIRKGRAHDCNAFVGVDRGRAGDEQMMAFGPDQLGANGLALSREQRAFLAKSASRVKWREPSISAAARKNGTPY